MIELKDVVFVHRTLHQLEKVFTENNNILFKKRCIKLENLNQKLSAWAKYVGARSKLDWNIFTILSLIYYEQSWGILNCLKCLCLHLAHETSVDGGSIQLSSYGFSTILCGHFTMSTTAMVLLHIVLWTFVTVYKPQHEVFKQDTPRLYTTN